jgi:hypothetical protein
MGILIRIGYVLNYVLSRDIAGRTVAKLPDDRFLVAYPGSGANSLLFSTVMTFGFPTSWRNN